jgi:hypothetical protein
MHADVMDAHVVLARVLHAHAVHTVAVHGMFKWEFITLCQQPLYSSTENAFSRILSDMQSLKENAHFPITYHWIVWD